jgi:hypothetical protein
MPVRSGFSALAASLLAILIVPSLVFADQAPDQGVLPKARAQSLWQWRRPAFGQSLAEPLIFLPATIYSTGSPSAWSIAAGDLNHDGKIDLAATNSKNSIAILLGNGDGTFQPEVSYSLDGAESVAIADLNDDGNPDLVGSVGTSLDIQLGNGDGTFQPAVSYSLGSQDTNGLDSLAVADLNGDGHLDVVVADGYFGGVEVLLGNGDGTLRPAVFYSREYYAQGVTIADMNGDGKPDVLIAGNDKTYHGWFGVLIGNGDGTFKPVVNYSSGSGESFSFSAAVADFNGDGKPDVVVANDGTDSVSVFLGNGNGTFQPAVNFFLATGTALFRLQ